MPLSPTALQLAAEQLRIGAITLSCVQALSVLTNLRKLCNHPALYRSADAEDDGAAEGGEEGAAGQAFDPDQSGTCEGRLLFVGCIEGAACSIDCGSDCLATRCCLLTGWNA